MANFQNIDGWLPPWAPWLAPELARLESRAQRRSAMRKAVRRIGLAPVLAYWALKLAWVILCVWAATRLTARPDTLTRVLGFAGLVPVACGGPATIELALNCLFRRRLRRALRRVLNESGFPICEACGYDLRGAGGPRCSECGAAMIARPRAALACQPEGTEQG